MLGEQLSPAQRQLVEIMRALIADVRVIAFDEPTSSLSDTEVDALFALVRRLRDNGVAVLYVSHRMPEIFAIADRVTVLRDGAVVGTRPVPETTTDELVSMMVGRDLTGMYIREPHPHGNVVLSVRGLSSADVHDISFDVRAGEVLGISGLVGAGRSELAHAIVGNEPRSAGDIAVAAERAYPQPPGRCPRQARPGSRGAQGPGADDGAIRPRQHLAGDPAPHQQDARGPAPGRSGASLPGSRNSSTSARRRWSR